MPQTLAIATASPGGSYYAYGQTVASIISRAIHIEATAQVTQGPAQNVVLLDKRDAMLAFVTTGAAAKAWDGADWTKGERHRAMRAIFPMYDTSFQFVAPKRLGLEALADFSGRRVGVGPRAGTGGTYVPELFEILNIAADLRFGGIEQQVRQVVGGELDAVVFAGGAPIPALAELAASQTIAFIEPSATEAAALRARHPELSSSLVPAEAYASLAGDYHTIGLYNLAVAHRDLDDDLVYAIVKAVFEHRDEIVQAHPAAKGTRPEDMRRNTVLPVHPGAARYYREIGVSIPSPAEPGD